MPARRACAPVAAVAPRLILVCGAPGAGKSEFARWLVPRLRAAYLDKDELNDAFDPDLRAGPLYDGLVRPVTYRAIWRLAEANLRLGLDVVVEAPLLNEIDDPEWRRERLAHCATIGAQLVAFQALVPEPVLRERLTRRGLARDAVRLRDDASWRAFVDRTRACEPRVWPGVLHVVPMGDGIGGEGPRIAAQDAGLLEEIL